MMLKRTWIKLVRDIVESNNVHLVLICKFHTLMHEQSINQLSFPVEFFYADPKQNSLEMTNVL